MNFKIAFTTIISFLSLKIPVSSAESLEKSLTNTTLLKNGIPVVARETKGTDIVHVEVTFKAGTSHQTPDRRALNLLAFETMPYATKKFNKESIFALSEKYSFGVECKGGVETSHCQVETITEYLPKALDLLMSIVTEPSFEPEDVGLAKKQRIANFQQESQNPEAHVNSVVNSIFYEKDHPFRLLPEDGITQTEAATPQDLKHYHRSILEASSMYVVYAGPKINKTTLSVLDSKLGKIEKVRRLQNPVPAPKFDPGNSFAFDHRPIPTAYIRMKFNAPSILSADSAAAEVMFEILSEKLHEEVRTKRSLSYSIHAGTIQYSQGIGMIVATTSKPRETLEVIASVVKNLRDNGVSQEELNEYRNIFSTNYFLTMETHDQLAAALASEQNYFGDASRLYDLREKLNSVTTADILRVAQDTLKNFRIGIVYDKDKFKNEWIAPIKSL